MPISLWIPPIGIVRSERVLRILELSGWRITSNPFAADAFAGWGRKPLAKLAYSLSCLLQKPFITLEDGFLRSVGLGLSGAPPLSIVMDDTGIYFDGRFPSRLEEILADADLSDPVLLKRAKDLRCEIRGQQITKYNTAHASSNFAGDHKSYVLIIDQRAGDQSIRSSEADTATFEQMVLEARKVHPELPILVKAHPDSKIQGMKGHFKTSRNGPIIISSDVNPWTMIENAEHVYTVSSQMGFEALMAEKRVTVFGRPFYAGWGLTCDRKSFPRRQRKLTIDQLTAAVLLIYPTYYDPINNVLCDAETVVERLVAALVCTE